VPVERRRRAVAVAVLLCGGRFRFGGGEWSGSGSGGRIRIANGFFPLMNQTDGLTQTPSSRPDSIGHEAHSVRFGWHDPFGWRSSFASI
jgi:hypothetical protein